MSFVDPKKVRPTMRRGRPVYGYCYMRAGFDRDDDTVGGLWCWRMPPYRMPKAEPPRGVTMRLLA